VAELVIITDEVEECNFNDAMAIFKGMSVVSEISGVIRVY
jgi:homoserine dehydrogenase